MSTRTDPSMMPKPRMGEFGDHPGAYGPIVRLHDTVVDPGEEVRGDVFITGYGEIAIAKLHFTPPSGVFDRGDSEWWFGMTIDSHPNGSALIRFGQNKKGGDVETGITMHLTGISSSHWSRGTMFFDVADSTSSVPQIASECSLERAPIEFRLRTLKTVRPGNYMLRFALTYYNGNEWRVTYQDGTFRIRGLLDRYQAVIAVVGGLAAAATILLAATALFGTLT